VSDFTNAKIFNPDNQKEVTQETELGTTALDMFAIGCIIAELELRCPLFPDVPTPADQLTKMYHKRKYGGTTGRQPNLLDFPILK